MSKPQCTPIFVCYSGSYKNGKTSASSFAECEQVSTFLLLMVV